MSTKAAKGSVWAFPQKQTLTSSTPLNHYCSIVTFCLSDTVGELCGNDVLVISADSGRLGVSKMADPESSHQAY
jgi:hypothetical protein